MRDDGLEIRLSNTGDQTLRGLVGFFFMIDLTDGRQPQRERFSILVTIVLSLPA